jgi:hypothetical protein
MAKKFNITGLCIPREHYMADISAKMDSIVEMVANGDYFTINRPRQYGKSTCLEIIERQLSIGSNDYFVLFATFESMSAIDFQSEKNFIREFSRQLNLVFKTKKQPRLEKYMETAKDMETFGQLGDFITGMVEAIGKPTVLLIDEVDQSSDNQLFLSFLGLLRSKYLQRHRYSTFHSVILAGVYDIKTLKLKIRPDGEKKYNSPWNIAADFKVDLELFPDEIASMLEEYAGDRQVKIDIPFFKENIYYYTSGYPFLVSYLCKIIDEEILPHKTKKEWEHGDLLKALHIGLAKDNTNFDTLVKNLENNPELYEFVFKIIMNEREFSYNSRNPLINLGTIHGILKKDQGKTRIHNRIYEQLIYDYMSSRLEMSDDIEISHVSSSFIEKNGVLNIEKVIKKFQQFIKEQYNKKDTGFIERSGRLLFLAFIKPIINGKGFDFKEVQVSEEKRLDVVITYENRRYIIELKIWRGESYHQEGITQLFDYLDRQNERIGYLLIYDPRKKSGRSGQWEEIEKRGKKIIAAWV